MIVAFWVSVGIYLLGVFFLSIGYIVTASTAFDQEDRVRAARILVSIPIWPLYWGKRLVILVAESAQILKEIEEKEKK